VSIVAVASSRTVCRLSRLLTVDSGYLRYVTLRYLLIYYSRLLT